MTQRKKYREETGNEGNDQMSSPIGYPCDHMFWVSFKKGFWTQEGHSTSLKTATFSSPGRVIPEGSQNV
jgi:hypothetical protein